MRFVFAAPHVVVEINLSSMKTNHTSNVHSVTEKPLMMSKKQCKKMLHLTSKTSKKKAFKGNKHIKIK